MADSWWKQVDTPEQCLKVHFLIQFTALKEGKIMVGKANTLALADMLRKWAERRRAHSALRNNNLSSFPIIRIRSQIHFISSSQPLTKPDWETNKARLKAIRRALPLQAKGPSNLASCLQRCFWEFTATAGRQQPTLIACPPQETEI